MDRDAAGQKPGIYCLAPESGWNNQQLTKNCGVLPYLFYREYGFHAVMAGVRNGSYPALERYVKGLEMEFLPDASMAAGRAYISQRAADMDVLVLHGPFAYYLPLLDHYRQLRPDGKVYLELDLNIYSAERLDWDRPEFRRFLSQCTVVGASCRRMQQYLSAKWPCVIEYIPNGFYNFAQVDLRGDFAQKQNIILTVGRIGTAQKRNETLLQAFARAADSLTGWQVVLAGAVTDSFRGWLESFFVEYPQLRERVVLTGMIEDKAELMAWYRRAKIFALTSELEGGTPNVVAEALNSGCYMITSEIDGAADITDFGRCGRSFPIGDAAALAGLLPAVCGDAELMRRGGEHAIGYAQRTFDFQRILARLYYLLFQEVRL